MSTALNSRWSLSLLIIGSILLMTALAIITTSEFFRHYLQKDFNHSARLQAQQTLQVIANSVLDDLITEDIPKLETFVVQLTQNKPDLIYLQINNEQGEQLIYWSRDQQSLTGLLNVNHEIKLEGEVFGTIQLGASLEQHYALIDEQLNTAIMLVVVIILALIIVILFLIRKLVIRPLKRINQHIERLTQGRFGDDLQIRSSRDMEYLADTINAHARVLRQQKDNEQQLKLERDRAEKASQAKSDFLSSMSHELRTPLNAILGFAQILSYSQDIKQAEKDSVGEIIRAGDHLLMLVNQVLDLAKIESGKIDLNIQPVNIYKLGEECLSLLDALAVRNHVRLLSKVNADMVVYADAMRLKQILINLLGNAIKYNHPDGYAILDANIEGEFIQITVEDNGRGIDADFMQEMFEPFNRLAIHDAAIEGTGIGLSLSKNLIEMMAGSIAVESELGKGSKFTLSLPLTREFDLP